LVHFLPLQFPQGWCQEVPFLLVVSWNSRWKGHYQHHLIPEQG
jgi:hypothetical protein